MVNFLQIYQAEGSVNLAFFLPRIVTYTRTWSAAIAELPIAQAAPEVQWTAAEPTTARITASVDWREDRVLRRTGLTFDRLNPAQSNDALEGMVRNRVALRGLLSGNATLHGWGSESSPPFFDGQPTVSQVSPEFTLDESNFVDWPLRALPSDGVQLSYAAGDVRRSVLLPALNAIVRQHETRTQVPKVLGGTPRPPIWLGHGARKIAFRGTGIVHEARLVELLLAGTPVVYQRSSWFLKSLSVTGESLYSATDALLPEIVRPAFCTYSLSLTEKEHVSPQDE